MLKKWIRRWLGIYVEFFPDEIAIRKMIAEELVKVMNNTYDGNGWNGSGMCNAFTRTIDFSIDRKFDSRLSTDLNRIVESEAFLDRIIERIKRKQL